MRAGRVRPARQAPIGRTRRDHARPVLTRRPLHQGGRAGVPDRGPGPGPGADRAAAGGPGQRVGHRRLPLRLPGLAPGRLRPGDGAGGQAGARAADRDPARGQRGAGGGGRHGQPAGVDPGRSALRRGRGLLVRQGPRPRPGLGRPAPRHLRRGRPHRWGGGPRRRRSGVEELDPAYLVRRGPGRPADAGAVPRRRPGGADAGPPRRGPEPPGRHVDLDQDRDGGGRRLRHRRPGGRPRPPSSSPTWWSTANPSWAGPTPA